MQQENERQMRENWDEIIQIDAIEDNTQTSVNSAAERGRRHREKRKTDEEYREAEKQRCRAYRERRKQNEQQIQDNLDEILQMDTTQI